MSEFYLNFKRASGANLDHIGGNKANTTSPAFWGIVQNVVNTEVGVGGRELIQVLLQQNIVLINVCKEQVDLCLIFWVPQDRLNDLQHRSDTSSTGDHAESADKVGAVMEVPLGALDPDSLPNLETGDILGDVASRVGLDKKGELALVNIRRDGGV